MTKKDKIATIENVIDHHAVYQYLSANWGEYLGIYRNGAIYTGDTVGLEILPSDRPIISVKCPGIGNINLSEYAENWADCDNQGQWIETQTGKIIGYDGSDKEMLYEACHNGEVWEDVEHLTDLLIGKVKEEDE